MTETLQEFKITDNLSLRLKNESALSGGTRTVVVVNGKETARCMFLMLNIPFNESHETFDYVNIDEFGTQYSRDMERNRKTLVITPEQEFWGHCSNIQAWVDNDYNPNLLHSNLSVPLLTELATTDVKIFHKLLYHLDNMWKEYKTLERKEFVYDRYQLIIRKCLLKYKVKKDDYKHSTFIKVINELIVIRNLESSLMRFKRDTINYHHRKIEHQNRIQREKEAKIREARQRKFNRVEREIWGTGKENLKYRKWLRKLRNHQVSVVSSVEDYPAYLWSMYGNKDRYYSKWHDLVDYHTQSKGGARIIASAYIAEGITHYYFLDWEYTFSNGWSGSHTLCRVIVRYKDGTFAIRHLIT